MVDTSYSLDYAKWPTRRQVLTLDDAVDQVLGADGLISVCGPHPPIDVLALGVAAATSDPSAPILVGLSGAVAGRGGKPGPFLSGVGIARDTGLPLIALSDPSLALDPDLPLAWYAGNHAMRDLPVKLATLLRSVADRTGRRLLLFGGSGGGFAAIMLASLLGERATALAWNPQTAISEYVPRWVAHYLRTAFPSAADDVARALEFPDSRANALLREVLERECAHHDLRDALRGGHRVLYMQNLSDWHVPKHVGPYINALHPSARDGSTLVSANQHQVIWFGAWGDGHVAPPRELILTALLALAGGADPAYVAARLDGVLTYADALAPTTKSLRYGSRTHSLSLSVEACAEQLKVQAALAANLGPPTAQVEYAFYVLRDGKRDDVRWYQRENAALFRRPTPGGRLQVQAFARDIFNDVLVSLPVDLPA